MDKRECSRRTFDGKNEMGDAQPENRQLEQGRVWVLSLI